MNFATYYSNRFRNDLNMFVSKIPNDIDHHCSVNDEKPFTIQNKCLWPEPGFLSFLSKSDKEYFGVALYFTVLVDMVCYTHFRTHYSKFQKLTQYPKFKGFCTIGCLHHFEPFGIFVNMNRGVDVSSKNYLKFKKKFKAAEPTMERETVDFFAEHMKEIDGPLFWDKCQQEFPLLT